MSRFAVVLCLLVLLPRPASAQTTALYFDSQAGDYIGQGQERTWTASDLQFSAQDSTPSRVAFTAESFDTTPWTEQIWWRLSFRAPSGVALAPGVYENAAREPFAGDGLPGLSVTGDGRGCNRLMGRFEVYEIEFNPSGQLTRFSADFEQHCEDGIPALFGAIRFNSQRSSLNPFSGVYPVYAISITPTPYGFVSGPGIDCGADRIDCGETYTSDTSVALTATPLPGYVFLGWSSPDCSGAQVATVRVFRRRSCTALFDISPGGGAVVGPDYSFSSFYLDRQPTTGVRTKRVYQPPLGSMSPFLSTPQRVRFFLEDELTGWREPIEFQAPFGAVLAPGVYNYAATSSGWEGGSPAITFSGCYSGGRFVVYDVTFTGSSLTSFAADFELQCDSPGGKTAGSIRYLSSRKTLLPFDGVYPTFSLEVVPGLGGRVTAAGDIDCGDGGAGDCLQTYSAAETVALQAIASPGYVFVAWGGSCNGAGDSVAVIVDRTLRCFAVFSPAPGSTSPGDPANAVATLYVEAPGATTPPTRSLFVWPDAEVEATYSTSTRTFTISFRSSSSAPGGDSSGYLSMRSPSGALIPGDYEEAYGRPNSLFPYLSVANCSVTLGRFRVYEAVFDTGGAVLSFAADFEARCSNSSRPYVVGAVRFNSSRRSLVPFDGAYPVHKLKIIPALHGTVTGTGVDCGPDGHDDCEESFGSAYLVSLVANPAPGYRFVAWGGACEGPQSTIAMIGGGVRRCYAVFNSGVPGIRPEDPRLAQASFMIDSDPGGPTTTPTGSLRRIWTDAVIYSSGFSRNMARMSLTMPDGSFTSLEFRAPGTNELMAQTYEGASSSSSSTGPRVSFSGPMFRFCSPGPLVGRFVVHEITFQSPTSNQVIAFAADFEVRCVNTTPAMRGSIRMNSSRATVIPFASATHPGHLPADFSGDGSPDLVWRNSVTGRNAFWFMNGDTMGATPPFSAGADLVADLDWEIRAVGDMDGDRRGDVIWQHATNGKLAAWLFVGATRVATPLFITLSGSPTEPDLDWKIVGAADMNADGGTDILWRHRLSGALRVWHMRGMEQLESVDLPLVVADDQWQIGGIADVNSDGWPDIIWRHYGSGRLAAWFMIDTFVVSTTVLPTLVSDTQWRLAGVADLNRDGHPDFVWQHLTGGKLAVWYLNGLNPVHYGMITPGVISDPNWRIVGVR